MSKNFFSIIFSFIFCLIVISFSSNFSTNAVNQQASLLSTFRNIFWAAPTTFVPDDLDTPLTSEEEQRLTAIRASNARKKIRLRSLKQVDTQPVSKPTINELKESTARLSVNWPKSKSWGSGVTINCALSAQEMGKYDCYVLTVNHLFEGITPKADFFIEYFKGDKLVSKHPFVVVKRDREADLALVKFISDKALPTRAIADKNPVIGERVTQIGYPEGKIPVQTLGSQGQAVTAVNRYLGTGTIECTGQPVSGRSGGPLFNEAGKVIGICSAAEPKEKKGIYASTDEINKFLRSR